MKCPYCDKEMIIGSISQDRYALKWVPADKDKGILNFTPLVKGIKLTSMMDDLRVKVYYCEPVSYTHLEEHISLSEVRKAQKGSVITYGRTK